MAKDEDKLCKIGSTNYITMESAKSVFKDIMHLSELIGDPSNFKDPIQYEKICQQLTNLAQTALDCYGKSCDSYVGYAEEFYPDISYMDMNNVNAIISNIPERRNVAKENMEIIKKNLEQAVKGRYNNSENSINKGDYMF